MRRGQWIIAHQLKQKIRSVCLFLGVIIVCIIEITMIQTYQKICDMDSFRTFQIDPVVWSELEEQYGIKTQKFYEKLTLLMLQTSFNPAQNHKTMPEFCYRIGPFRSKYREYKKMYQMFLDDIGCFPVAEDFKGGETTSFDNSWGGVRTYGGKRRHEGTDIMTSNNKRGYFPIISMTDGIVEKKGWLPQGGYRLGIRSPKGAYYYYAHLHSYAETLKEGDIVQKGDLLGRMGDTGYSEVEGTVGNFDVHLHMGIYIDYMGKEMSVNPYYVLKHYENKKIKFCFKNK